MTEDETVGWHHQLNGHEFEQTPGDGEGHGSPACCSPWARKEPDTTEQLKSNKSNRQQKIMTQQVCIWVYRCLLPPVSFWLILRQVENCIHTMEHYSAIKRNQLLTHATMWIRSENTMLGKSTQTQKATYFIILSILFIQRLCICKFTSSLTFIC